MPLTEYLAKTPEKKYLIFDFDETLFHLHLPWDIYQDGKHKILKKFDQSYYEQMARSDNDEDLVNLFVAKYGTVIWQPLRDWALEFETKYLKAAPENKQLTKWLADHRQYYHYFIWSNNCGPTIERVLKEMGYDNWFELIVGKDKVTYGKPKRDGFELIYNHVEENFEKNPPLGSFLMTGNSLQSDKGAAESAGINYLYHQFSVPY